LFLYLVVNTRRKWISRTHIPSKAQNGSSTWATECRHLSCTGKKANYSCDSQHRSVGQSAHEYLHALTHACNACVFQSAPQCHRHLGAGRSQLILIVIFAW